MNHVNVRIAIERILLEQSVYGGFLGLQELHDLACENMARMDKSSQFVCPIRNLLTMGVEDLFATNGACNAPVVYGKFSLSPRIALEYVEHAHARVLLDPHPQNETPT